MRVQDENGNSFRQSLTLILLPVPTAINLSNTTVNGGKPSGTTVGTLSTTEHQSIHTYVYSLVSGAVDNGNFTIGGNIVKTAAVFNAATKSSYTILVRVQEDNGNWLQ